MLSSQPNNSDARIAPKILFSVSVDESLKLLGNIPYLLAKEGWEVHIVSNPGPQLAAVSESRSVTTHKLKMSRRPDPLRDVISFIGWLRLLTRLKPDVISVGTPKASLLGLTAGFLYRVPYRVYVLRGLRLETSKGIVLWALSLLEKLTARSATLIHSVSESLRKEYLKRGFTTPEKITLIGNGSSKGVNIVKFRPPLKSENLRLSLLAREIGLSPGVPVIGLFGRLAEDKGVKTFGEALTILERQNVRCQVLVIGADESSGSFMKQTDLSSIGVQVLPHAESLEVYFRLLDVLCVPTLREGLPNVALEAQASGVPVVTTDATGAIDSILPNSTGLIARKGDPYHLANLLREIVEDSKLRQSLSSKARPWVSETFDSTVVENQIFLFYKNLLATPGAPQVPQNSDLG